MSQVLIVHAHHEPQSFSTSMARRAADTLLAQGHQVEFTDLHAMGFQPVSDRRNFTTVADPAYLKQQQEEAFATEHGSFSPELEAEIRKLEQCDLLIFSFPLWWFSMPAILKGWVDRVFAYQRIYSRGQWYENGVGRGKRAMVLMTTGGAEAKYGPGGLHATLNTVLDPIHKGIFGFNGFSPLPAFVAWAAAHGTDQDRRATLDQLQQRIDEVFTEPVIELPRFSDFDPVTAIDTVPRFMATARRRKSPDEAYHRLIPEEVGTLNRLRRRGKILSARISPPETADQDWRAFLVFRESSAEAVREICAALPLAAYLDFEITPLDVVHGF